ncbi:hypothetical protein [uncultured Sphingomonas sp.]|uniref:hypothetical protein n=1 Tax=uncultured Sphingomonas sp. TaxID=158754 RepID=UPI0025FA02BE|nr:hypothetical protein [uncultured Sphingomonas sp.]
MTGADIIGAVLRAHAPLIAIVPVERIKGGRLPDDVALPALLVRTISSGERPALKRQATVRITDRVAVAVRAASYREQKAIMKLVRSCCAGRTGAVGGGQGVAIADAGGGPDLNGPGNSFEQSQDYRVGFLDAA